MLKGAFGGQPGRQECHLRRRRPLVTLERERKSSRTSAPSAIPWLLTELVPCSRELSEVNPERRKALPTRLPWPDSERSGTKPLSISTSSHLLTTHQATQWLSLELPTPRTAVMSSPTSKQMLDQQEENTGRLFTHMTAGERPCSLATVSDQIA